MNDFVLAVIGSVGIAALAMSVNDAAKKKSVREEFMMFPARTRLDKLQKDEHGNIQAFPVDQYPNIKCGGNKGPAPVRQAPVEHFAARAGGRSAGSGLGAASVADMPYITPTPHLNQSVPKMSPSLNLPSLLRYNAPSLDKMGITDSYQCNRTPVRENYEAPQSTCAQPSKPYMSGEVLGSNYSASPRQMTMDKYINAPEDGLAMAGEMKDPFDGKEVMVFDRAITTTLKVGRFAGRGTRDLIRGDLPVAPNTHQGWFSTPADPTALSKGALQAIAGENENSTTLNKFMEIYGDNSGVGAGVNLEYPVDYQYTAYEMTNKNQGVCNNTISVQSF